MKKIISLVCAVCLTLGFVGCGSANKAAENTAKNTAVNETKNSESKAADKSEKSGEVEWNISIEGVGDKAIEYTNLDIEKLEMVELNAVQKKKDGSTKEQQWNGPLVKNVFEQIGVKEYSSAIFEASDGYSKEVTKDILESEGTIIGIQLEGKELEEKYAPAQLVIDGKGSKWWVKKLAKITIKK
jgi:DMSO/TMAO reductase YedYZ molybdopterin-dependent catalytic subunit